MIWISVPLIGLLLTAAFVVLGDKVTTSYYAAAKTASSTTETLIALPGAFSSAIFFLSLFIVPPYIAKAWRAWRYMRRLAEQGSASLIAGWTVTASDWARFQRDLQGAHDKGDGDALSKLALSLCDLDAPEAGVDIRVGEEGVQVGARYFALHGGLSSSLTAVAPGVLGRTAPRPGADYLAFVSTFEGSSRSLGAYAVEEIGLMVPVPPPARAAMQRVLDHFTPAAIADLKARDAQRGRIGCLLNLGLLAVSIGMLAIYGIFDIQSAGWYGLLLFAAWLVWLAFYLMQVVVALVVGLGHMIRMMRTPR
ncbi:hypothetical protein [Sphingopyxis sp. 550A]